MTRTKASPLAVWLRINILWQSNQRRHAPQRMGMSRHSSLSHPGQMSFPVLGNWWLHFISRSLWALQPTQNTGLIFSVSLSISSPTSSYTLALLGPRKLGADKSLGWRMSWKGAERGFPSLECSQYRGPGSVIHPRFEWTWTFCSGSWENKSVTPRDHSRFQLFLTDHQQNEKNKNILLFIILHFFLLKNPTSSRDYFFSFGSANKSF